MSSLMRLLRSSCDLWLAQIVASWHRWDTTRSLSRDEVGQPCSPLTTIEVRGTRCSLVSPLGKVKHDRPGIKHRSIATTLVASSEQAFTLLPDPSSLCSSFCVLAYYCNSPFVKLFFHLMPPACKNLSDATTGTVGRRPIAQTWRTVLSVGQCWSGSLLVGRCVN